MAKTYGNFTDFIDFSRASSATYMGSDGLIKTATDNEPRVEYDANGNVKGLLIEEARTNLLTNSSHGGGYADQGINVSVVDFLGVIGEAVAVTEDTGTSLHRTKTENLTLTLSTDYVASVYVANYSGSRNIYLNTVAIMGTGVNFDPSLGVINSTVGSPSNTFVEDLGGGIYRVSWTGVGTGATNGLYAQSNTTTAAGDDNFTGDGSSGFVVWGIQIEAGSFPTSYIPTSGSTATRSADIASIPVTDFGYNQKAGTVVVDVNTFDTDYSNWVWVLDGTSDTSLYGHSAASGWRVYGAGGTVGYLGSLPANADAQIGYAYSNVGSATLLDGGSVSTTAHSQPVAVTTVRLGAATTSAAFLNGHIKSIAYYPRRLSNAQLQEFTS